MVGWQVFASFGMVGFSFLDGSMVSLLVGVVLFGGVMFF